MTYNFDPDRWYEDQLRLLEIRRRDGALDERAYAEALQELERRYEKMVARLDGTFELPPEGRAG
jgi:hypothetical protein